jgi:hypothetical protein
LPIWTEIINRRRPFLLHLTIFSKLFQTELFEAEARASARADNYKKNEHGFFYDCLRLFKILLKFILKNPK